MNIYKTVEQIKSLKSQYQGDGPRRNVRLAVRSGASVIFKKTPRFRFGKPRIVQSADIIDINANGLRVQYSSDNKWSTQFDHISIVSADEISIVDDINCKILSDCQVAQSSDGSYSRVCGLKFQKLSDKQKHRINKFIRDNTVDPNDLSRWHVQFS